MTGRAARRPRIVKCPGCDKPAKDGRPTTEIDTVERGYGTSPSGKTYLKDVPGKRVWHTDCLDAFKAQNEALRRTERVQNLRDVYEGFVVPGHITRESFIQSATRNGRTADEIEEAMR